MRYQENVSKIMTNLEKVEGGAGVVPEELGGGHEARVLRPRADVVADKGVEEDGGEVTRSPPHCPHVVKCVARVGAVP